MALDSPIRGVRPGVRALRNEREVFVDPERESKLQMYQRRAELELPLFDPNRMGRLPDSEPGRKS